MATSIFNGVYGSTEANIKDLFSFAKTKAPCILFIDRLEAVFQRRDSHQAMENQVSQLLSSMEGKLACAPFIAHHASIEARHCTCLNFSWPNSNWGPSPT